MQLDSKQTKRLGNMLALLASDQDGEVLNAARQVVRIAREAEIDWHELLKAGAKSQGGQSEGQASSFTGAFDDLFTGFGRPGSGNRQANEAAMKAALDEGRQRESERQFKVDLTEKPMTFTASVTRVEKSAYGGGKGTLYHVFLAPDGMAIEVVLTAFNKTGADIERYQGQFVVVRSKPPRDPKYSPVLDRFDEEEMIYFTDARRSA